jgi:hypothetical protein
MRLTPALEGSANVQSRAEPFFQAFRRRVDAGLLTGRPHPRSRYVVTGAGPDRLEMRAADWWSAINVGLNEVELRYVSPGAVRYRVRYWRWARYVLALSGSLGLAGIVMLLSLDVRGYIAGHRASMIPGLSINQNLFIAWLMVMFWGFVWPWLLIALHKRPLHRLISRLIAEVDDEAASPGGRSA